MSSGPSIEAPTRVSGEPSTLPTSAALAEVSVQLRTRGFGPATAGFDALAATLLPHAPTLGTPLLRALLAAREALDSLTAADLLDGAVAPGLGLEGALVAHEVPDAPFAAGLELDLREGLRRASRLDPAGEAELQLGSIGGAAAGPIAVLGANGSALVRAIAGLDSTHPLLIWDPADSQADDLSAVARRPLRRLRSDQVTACPETAVWIHPALTGTLRARAERVRARLLASGTVPTRVRLDPDGPLRVVVLLRETPFHLDAPLVATLRLLGHPTAVATLHGDERDEALAAALVQRRPDLVLSVNGAALTGSASMRAALEVAEVPTVLWFVDDPELALGDALDLASPHVLAFAWEREAVARLRRLGFGGAQFLPHGARFATAQLQHPWTPLPDGPLLLWIGSSYAGADRSSLHAGAAAADEPAWQAIERRLDAEPRLAPAALRRALGRPSHRAELFGQLRAADHVAAGRRRAVARALLPAGLTIFGDVDGWRQQLGPHARILGDVDAVTVAPRLVAGARISVDCAHPQMPTAVTQRVFDVPACGGLVLADDRPDLREFFDVGTEVLPYASPEEAADRAQWALKHPDFRARMAAAARHRVLREHLLEHRVRRLLRIAAHHFGVRGAR